MKNFKRFISIAILVSFISSLIVSPTGAASVGGPLITSSVEGFQPPVLVGLKVHPENPLLFDFIVDQGEVKLSTDELKSETEKLVKYFLAALTIPDKEVWVNLSPTEKDRIIPDVLAQTVMGKTMLEQDYALKQLASSLTNPQTALGAQYWREIASSAPEAHPRNDMSKVWIVPEKAEVLESNGIVLVGEKKLQVKMADEYGSLSFPQSFSGNPQLKNGSPIKAFGDDMLSRGNDSSSQIFHDLILPTINKEVNESKDFADVRQIYNSVILATWYKQALKESLLGKVYADKSKVAGVETDDKEMKQRIYEQYLDAFKKGAYNLIKEEEDALTGEMIPRKYFSGGIADLDDKVVVRRGTPSEIVRIASSSTFIVQVATPEATTPEVDALRQGAVNIAASVRHQEVLDSVESILAQLDQALVGKVAKPTEYAEDFKQSRMDGKVDVPLHFHEYISKLVRLLASFVEFEENFEIKTALDRAIDDLSRITATWSADRERWLKKEMRGDVFITRVAEELLLSGDYLSLRIRDIEEPVLGTVLAILKPESEAEVNEKTVIQILRKDEDEAFEVQLGDIQSATVLRLAASSGVNRFEKIETSPMGIRAIVEDVMRTARLIIKNGEEFYFALALVADAVRDHSPETALRLIEAMQESIDSWEYSNSLGREQTIQILNLLAQDALILPNDRWQDEKQKAAALNIPLRFGQRVRSAESYINQFYANLQAATALQTLTSQEAKFIAVTVLAKNNVKWQINKILEWTMGRPLIRAADVREFLVIQSDPTQIQIVRENLKAMGRDGMFFNTDGSAKFLTNPDQQQMLETISASSAVVEVSLSPDAKTKLTQLQAQAQTSDEIKTQINEQTLQKIFAQMNSIAQSGVSLNNGTLEYKPRLFFLFKRNIVNFSSLSPEESKGSSFFESLAQREAAVLIAQSILGLTEDENISLGDAYGLRVGDEWATWEQLVNEMDQRGITIVQNAASAAASSAADQYSSDFEIGVLQSAGVSYDLRSGKITESYSRSDAYSVAVRYLRDYGVNAFQRRIFNSVVDYAKSRNRELSGQQTENLKTDVEKFVTAFQELSTASSGVNEDGYSRPAPVGGIDFDPTNMNLQIKRDGKGVPLPLPQQNLEQINIQGLFPVIINIVPVNAQTLPIFLGQIPPEPAKESELLATSS